MHASMLLFGLALSSLTLLSQPAQLPSGAAWCGLTKPGTDSHAHQGEIWSSREFLKFSHQAQSHTQISHMLVSSKALASII